jgi:cytochrome c553
MAKTITLKSFGAFLDATKAHRSPAGDFVKDARTDNTLRHFDAANNWKDVQNHLCACGACHEAHEAGKAVWSRYRAWLRHQRKPARN